MLKECFDMLDMIEIELACIRDSILEFSQKMVELDQLEIKKLIQKKNELLQGVELILSLHSLSEKLVTCHNYQLIQPSNETLANYLYSFCLLLEPMLCFDHTFHRQQSHSPSFKKPSKDIISKL